jgi:hypothetical protein
LLLGVRVIAGDPACAGLLAAASPEPVDDAQTTSRLKARSSSTLLLNLLIVITTYSRSSAARFLERPMAA